MSDQLLNLLVNFLVYSDGAPSNSPKLRDVDYARQLVSIPTGNSYSQRMMISPQSSQLIMQTQRSLTQDATTQYTVSLISGSTYRFRHSGGTNPTLRTKRSFTFSALTEFDVSKVGDIIRYTWNGTGVDPNFATNGVIVGDVVHILTGTPFNSLNQGTFTVVGVTDDWFEVLNSSGVPEITIALGPNIDSVPPMSIYSAAGVQVGDQARIVATAFNVENRGIFTITEVTSEYFELSNGNPGIPEGPITLGAANGIVFYPDVYKWLYIEADQKVSIRINGDTSDNVELEPVIAADPSAPAVYLQRGGVFKLEIANNGVKTASVKVALAE